MVASMSSLLPPAWRLGVQDRKAALCHAILEEHGADVDLAALGFFAFSGPMVADDITAGHSKSAKKEYNAVCLESMLYPSSIRPRATPATASNPTYQSIYQPTFLVNDC